MLVNTRPTPRRRHAAGRCEGTQQGPRKRRRTDREAVRQGFDHAPRPEGCYPAGRRHLDRIDQHRLRARHRRPAPRPRGGDLRTGVLREDHAGAAGDCRGAKGRGHGGLRGRRARARCAVRPEAGRRSRQPARLPARQRRTGARNRRGADPLGRRRRGGGGLGGGAGAQGRNRRRDGRRADGPPGAPDVPGAAQADRRRIQVDAPRSSSSTSCARRSASCSATRKPPPAGAR